MNARSPLVHSLSAPSSRRSWLRTCLGAGVAAFPGAALLRAADAPETCSLAMGTYGLQSLKLEDSIQLVADIGFDGLEITVFPDSTGDPAQLPADRRELVRKLIADSGLRLEAMMADLRPQKEDAKHSEEVERLQAILELAKSLNPSGGTQIQTVLGGKEGDDLEHFANRLGDWVPLAKEWDTTIAIKPHRSHALSLPEHGIELIQKLGSPEHLRLVYDYSHYAFRDQSIAKTVATALPWTSYIAVKDAVQQDGKVRFALPGTSDSWNHAEIIRGFYEGGYRGAFCCEVSSQVWRAEGYDAVEATKTSYRTMSSAFVEAGVQRA